jgi:thiamine biosynthesis lipoprotein
MYRHGFRAMGTSVTLMADDDLVDPTTFVYAADEVEAIFERLERRFSRFRTESELSGVNASAGTEVGVSGAFADLVAFALEQAVASDGLFDPTVLGAVEAAGYDRDFDEVLAGARGALRPPVPCGRWREVRLRDRRLRLPPGVGLDLGGVAKGWSVDVAATSTLAAGLPWAVVNAGGDLRVVGDAPAIDVGVEDPGGGTDEIARLSVHEGAIATSSTARRAWGPGLHHLIDPRTGAPADTGIVQATVWAPTCALAEIAAKRALLEGDAFLSRGPAVLVTEADVLMNLERAEVRA